MRVEPSKPRYTIRSEAGAITIACPPRRSWFALLFLAFWLGGWLAGEVCVLAVVGWQLAGLEQLTIVRGNLVQRVSIAGIGHDREFSGAEIRNLRASPQMVPGWADQRAFWPPFLGASNGAIAFDYGAKTYRIGASLDEAEARQIVTTLSRQYPRMVEAAAAR